jgi:hypothetical protein
MAFELLKVVPWGRNLAEYTGMFNLTDSDLNSKIISFGDGPASFNSEISKYNRKVISIDPIYQFTKDELKQRIKEIKDIVLEQTHKNKDNFVWTHIRNIQELEKVRMDSMTEFLKDFESGKRQGRYINHELPQKTQFGDMTFDLGLSSHFLILYSQLGLDFHIKSIIEMLRICKEIRVFPLLNLNAEKSEVLEGIIEYFNSDFIVSILKVDYEFQKNGNSMLKIKRK